jgi:hypothetical protein
LKIHRSLILILLSLPALHPAKAQSFSSSAKSVGTSWASNPFEHFVFVENKGQFDNKAADKNSKVYYNASSGGVEMYFAPGGVTYRHDNVIVRKNVHEEGSGKSEEDEKEKVSRSTKVEHQFLQVEWVGADLSAGIEASAEQSFYYTYASEKDQGKTTIKAACYKKIVYKNIYRNIDIEYILPEKGGLKYSLILHSGADLSLVKMRYKNAKGLSTQEGNIIIRSELGDFVDHAPVSFYEDGSGIRSAFKLNNNIVSFALSPSDPQQQITANKQRTIIIDPWTTNPLFLSSNSAYDVNYDLNGNVYAYGSTAPFKLVKFNSAGTILWMYNAVGFGLDAGAYTYGDFAVDEFSGTSYLGEAWVITNARIFKVNSSGIQTGTFGGGNNMSEIWRMEYNRCINKIIVVGGGSPVDALAVDTNMSTFTPVNIFNTATTNRDFQFLTIDNNSGFCYMAMGFNIGTQPGEPDNTLIKCPIPGLLPTAFNVPARHKIGELSSIQYKYSAHMNGMNGMAVSPNWLYTYDSDTLRRWNKNTGTYSTGIHVSPTAPIFSGGYIQVYWGGLSVDECDNIYVGFRNTVKVYNSSLSLVSTLAMPDTVYDVKLGPKSKLYVCGKNFVRELDVTANNTTVTVTQTPASGCSACNGTASVSSVSCGGNGSGFAYEWNTVPVQTTQTATGLCPGDYTVTLKTSCSITFTGTVTVTGGPGSISVSITSTPATCSNNNGTATANPSGSAGTYTYTWSNGQTSQTATGLSPNTYTVTVTDGTCTSIKTVVITKPLSVTSITSANLPCNNGGSATVTISASATGPYTYSWSSGTTLVSGATTNQSPNLSAGTYTVTVKDNNGCTTSQTFTIPPMPFVVSVQSQNISCNQSGDASVVINSGVGPYTYNWSNGFKGSSFSGLAAGSYTVTVTDGGGCTATKVFTITGGGGIADASFTQSPVGIVCIGTTVNFTHTGSAGTHNWAVSPSSVISGATTNFSFTFLTAGTYSVIHDVTNGGCVNSVTSIVTVSNCNSPTVTATSTAVCSGSCATVTSSPVGGTGNYTYSWSSGETTQNINPCPVATTTYTLTLTDGVGATTTTTVTTVIHPAISIAATSTLNCGTTNGSVTATVTGGSSNYTYSWSNGTTGTTSGLTSQISSLASNTYSVTVTDANGCSASSSAIIDPPFAAQYIKGTANCAGCGCKEWIMVTPSNGRAPFTYVWPGGYDKKYLNKICPGNYSIRVTDKNGCSVDVVVIAP